MGLVRTVCLRKPPELSNVRAIVLILSGGSCKELDGSLCMLRPIAQESSDVQHESVNALERANQRQRWQVKDFIVSPWHELPGAYTATEIFQLRRAGRFMFAVPVSEKFLGTDSARADLKRSESNMARIK